MIPATIAASALQNPNVTNGIKKVALGLGIATVLGVGYFIVNKKIKEYQLKQNYRDVEKQIGVNTPSGKAAGFASLLFSAMDGWGTNEDLIYDTLRKMKVTGIIFADVANAYRKLYGTDLLKEIQGELSSTEYVEFQQTI